MNKPLLPRALVALAVILICSCIFVGGRNDFAQYWVAPRLMFSGHNPYSTQESLAADRALGGPGPGVTMIPPWALGFVLPLGVFSYSTAQKIWFAVNFAALFVSAELAGRLYAPEVKAFRVWLLMFTLLPATVCLAIGQISPLVLLGAVAFIFFAGRKDLFAAGLCLFLGSLKPQLLYILWPALFVWALAALRRRWHVLAGLIAAIVLGSVAALAADHAVFSQYVHLWLYEKDVAEVFPTVAGALRLAIGREQRWVQVLPAACALLWLFLYSRKMQQLNWTHTTPLLIAVSLATSPYGWYFDQVVLWPAILQVLVPPKRSVIAAYVVLNLLASWLIVTHRTVYWFSWTAAAWLIFYMVARRHSAPPAAVESGLVHTA